GPHQPARFGARAEDLRRRQGRRQGQGQAARLRRPRQDAAVDEGGRSGHRRGPRGQAEGGRPGPARSGRRVRHRKNVNKGAAEWPPFFVACLSYIAGIASPVRLRRRLTRAETKPGPARSLWRAAAHGVRPYSPSSSTGKEKSMSSMSRRHLMFAATGIAAVAAAPRLVFAQAAAPAPAPAVATGPFTLPPLAYPTNAFEPHIDAKTMEIHHDRHHAAYVANLNNVAKTNPQLGTAKIEDVLGNLNALDDSIKFTVRNNLGGHANHTMFWEIMGPNGGKPEGEVLA